MKTLQITPCTLAPGLMLLALPLVFSSAMAGNMYQQTNLVSDLNGMARFTDPNLVNPWGIAMSGTSPFWVSNAGTGTASLYNTGGVPQALLVTVPGPSGGMGVPTGQVFNAGAAFNSDRFIFATAQGSIAGWRGPLGTTAETLFSSPGASYLGLAIGSLNSDTLLYAADFAGGKIDVYSSAGQTTLTGGFMDRTLPTGYSPFNVQNLGGSLYVTYALLDEDEGEEVVGVGNGYVSVFNLDGTFNRRLISGGVLNAPWGLAMAPASFGDFAGKLLVGNFGDGMIHAYDPGTGGFLDAIRDQSGDPIEIEGLWGLTFGNGGQGGQLDTLYFAAGIDDENHGLFGAIAPVPEPGTIGAGIGLVLIAGYSLRRRWRISKVKKAS